MCDRTRRDAISCRLVVACLSVGLIGLISLIGPIGLISPFSLSFSRPNFPKKCPSDTEIASNPHFCGKKSRNLLPFRKKVVPLHSLSETKAF